MPESAPYPSDRTGPLRADNLRCELLAAPRGLDVDAPRFSWALTGGGNGAFQSACEIIVGDSAQDVAAGIGSHWQSGRIETDTQLHIAYAGKPLASDEVLYWTVRVWDGSGTASDFAEVQTLMTGLRRRDDWQADWIARYFVLPAGREAPSDNFYDNRWQARPADHMRREFIVGDRPVRAVLYITALGLYRAFINGTRIGDDVMAPGWTDYHQRVLYQSFDVTDLVQADRNALGVILGEGWYSGRVGHNQRRAGNHYGGRPVLFCQLNLHFADGTTATVTSDSGWKTAQGPICYSDFLVGENYDARRELPGWNRPFYDDSAWQPVEVFTPEPREPVLTPEKCPPAREMQRLACRRIGQSANGAWIYDTGQNIAGYVELSVSASPGDRFTLRHAERLDAEGELYTANLRHAVAIDHYVAKGAARETFTPHFTFHGFQYVELSLPDGIAPETVELTAIAIWTDLPETGGLETGSELVNQLISNIAWSQRDNFLSVPTDCPQRDERLGWSADAQVFWRTAGFGMDVSRFFRQMGRRHHGCAIARWRLHRYRTVAPAQSLSPDRPAGRTWLGRRAGDHRLAALFALCRQGATGWNLSSPQALAGAYRQCQSRFPARQRRLQQLRRLAECRAGLGPHHGGDRLLGACRGPHDPDRHKRSAKPRTGWPMPTWRRPFARRTTAPLSARTATF